MLYSVRLQRSKRYRVFMVLEVFSDESCIIISLYCFLKKSSALI